MLGFIAPFMPASRRQMRINKRPYVCARHEESVAQATRTHVSPESRVIVPPIVFVLGGPGSGKGTQCEKLQRDFDLVQVCVGDLLRREAASDSPLGKNIAEIMHRGEIVPGEVTMALLKAELVTLSGECSGILIDGFPRAMDQARAFEELVATCRFVLFFRCEPEEMIARLMKRGKTSGRADDTEVVAKRRLRTFIDKTMPVVEHYSERGLLKEVNSGAGNPEEVYQHTKELFVDAFSPS